MLIYLTLQMAILEETMDQSSLMPGFHFSEWLDEFLFRLFSLLQNLEANSVV